MLISLYTGSLLRKIPTISNIEKYVQETPPAIPVTMICSKKIFSIGVTLLKIKYDVKQIIKDLFQMSIQTFIFVNK